MLQPADFSGLAALLVANPNQDSVSESKMRAALDRLMDDTDGNPLVQNLLTCLERELDKPERGDAFPRVAGRGGLPLFDETSVNAGLHAAGNVGQQPAVLAVQQAARVLHAQPFARGHP
eukprot:6538098-Prymnesium_polylepis.2